MSKSQGKVYILGAGPGNLAYLTVVGQHLLAKADVLIYDALINPKLLTLTARNCLQFSVGKRGGRPSTAQATIDQLLVDYCRQGRHVVRLKSGDPFVFGRTTSEIKALQAAGCQFEVLPGVSSALAAPLLAGIPLTDPALSRSFTILSAHAPSHLDWSTLAKLETLVILMGGHRVAEIVERLRQHGQVAQTPIAIIRWGGWEHQQVWVGTLDDIVTQIQGESLSPSVMVIGQVVSLQQTLAISPATTPFQLELCHQSYPSLVSAMSDSQPSTLRQPHRLPPLSGKTVLVTRSASQSREFSDRLQAVGATVLDMPALEIGPPSSWVALDAAIADLAQFNWLILTSANGVERFFERLSFHGQDARSLAGVKIAVVGRKTAASLKQQGLQADFVPPDFVADALAEHFPGGADLTGTTLLFPRVETGGREALVAQLTAKGATVVQVPAYQSRCPAAMDAQILTALRHQRIDVITFASSKTVQHFSQLLQQACSNEHCDGPSPDWHHWLRATCIASIGPQTSQTCIQLLGRVDLEAKEFTLAGLTQGLIDHFSAT